MRLENMAIEDMHAMMLAQSASEGMAQAMVEMLTAKSEGMDTLVGRPDPNPRVDRVPHMVRRGARTDDPRETASGEWEIAATAGQVGKGAALSA